MFYLTTFSRFIAKPAGAITVLIISILLIASSFVLNKLLDPDSIVYDIDKKIVYTMLTTTPSIFGAILLAGLINRQ